MVAVTIQPNTSAMRAQGRTFVLAILLKKILTDAALADDKSSYEVVFFYEGKEVERNRFGKD